MTTRSKYLPTVGMTDDQILEYYLKRSRDKFPNSGFDYSLITKCKTQSEDINIICDKHGIMNTTFGKHLGSITGCAKCGQEKASRNKSITFQEFLNRVDEAHPYKNFKILSKEFNNRIAKDSKVYVRDEFGVCLVSVIGLMKGIVPNIKTAVFPALYNKNRYNKIHNYSRLCFDNTEYKRALRYVTVKCRVHGEFLSKPNWLLNGNSCSKCYNDSRAEKISSNTKEFISKAIKRHNLPRDIYDRVDYVSAKGKVLIKCKVHNNYYSITPNDHLTGYGCPVCGLASGGITREEYIKSAKNGNNLVYFIRCWNEDEDFYKIGRTFKSVILRFGKGSSLRMPYNYEVLYEFKNDAATIFDKELELLFKYKEFKYNPNIYFEGRTECFSKDLPIEQIILSLKTPTK